MVEKEKCVMIKMCLETKSPSSSSRVKVLAQASHLPHTFEVIYGVRAGRKHVAQTGVYPQTSSDSECSSFGALVASNKMVPTYISSPNVLYSARVLGRITVGMLSLPYTCLLRLE